MIREWFSGDTHLSASPPGCLGHSEATGKVGFDQHTPFCHSKILESMGKIIRGLYKETNGSEFGTSKPFDSAFSRIGSKLHLVTITTFKVDFRSIL